MKILFLTNSLDRDNGGGIFSRQVIEGVTNRLGAEAVIFTITPSDDILTRPIKLSFFGALQTLWGIRAAARGCELIHVFDVFPHGILASLAVVGLHKKIVLTAIGSASIIPLFQKKYKLLARWSLRRADSCTAISAFTRNEILKKVPSVTVEVINPGIHLQEFEVAQRKPLSPPVVEMRPYILSVGTVRWRKGYRQSVAAFAEVGKRFPKLQYVIIGRHPWPSFVEELKELANKLGVPGRVIFLDGINAREELLAWYKGAELFCLFSENEQNDIEGFGIVFTEAAAMGLPVIGRKNCGVDDAVADGQNGLLVTSGEEFTKALETILTDTRKAQAMREASLAHAREFALERKTESYLSCYKRLGLPEVGSTAVLSR